MESKLGLNLELVNQARQSAAHVADDTQRFIDQHTTVTVERAVCRLLGIDGVNEMDVPLPNVVVDHMMATSFLPMGAAWAIGNAMLEDEHYKQAQNPYYLSGWFNFVNTELTNGFQALLIGEKTAQEVADGWCAYLEAELASYNAE